MRRLIVLAVLAWGTQPLRAQVADAVAPLLQQQYDLAADGRAFLLREAAGASFFMLGELHGDDEIPQLIRNIWPAMWESGYRAVAAEISPWAAHQLEFVPGKVRSAAEGKARSVNGVALRRSLIGTLEADRSAGASLQASVRREAVMKYLFLRQWRAAAGKPKVFIRFGRNHLHRGYDRRGVSTLENFVAELAAAEGLRTFNVAAFSGGGRIALAGPPVEFDERGDDPALPIWRRSLGTPRPSSISGRCDSSCTASL